AGFFIVNTPMTEQIQELIQEGKLEEAKVMAEQFVADQPDSSEARTQLAWVHYGYAKTAAKATDLKEFHVHLDAILALQPTDEGMLGNSMAWQVHRIAKTLLGQRPLPAYDLVGLLEKIVDLPFDKEQDIMASVMMLRLALKVKEEFRNIRSFIEWWNLEDLPENEYEPFETKQGRKVMSLAERAYITYAKQLVDWSQEDYESALPKVQEFLPQFERLMLAHPEYHHTKTFHSQLLLVNGDLENGVPAMINFIRSRPMETWAWANLGDAFLRAEDFEKAIGSYCKATEARIKPFFKARLKEALGRAFHKAGKLPEAKAELNSVIEFYKRGKNGVPPHLLELEAEEWYQSTEISTNMREVFAKYVFAADELLYKDMPESLAVVVHTDPAKKRVWFRLDREKTFSLMENRVRLRVAPGDFVAMRYQEVQSRKGMMFQILTIRHTDEAPRDIVREFNGSLNLLQGRSFGFVNRDIFIPPHLVEAHTLIGGQKLAGLAVIEYDKKRERWNWKAVKLNDNSSPRVSSYSSGSYSSGGYSSGADYVHGGRDSGGGRGDYRDSRNDYRDRGGSDYRDRDRGSEYRDRRDRGGSDYRDRDRGGDRYGRDRGGSDYRDRGGSDYRDRDRGGSDYRDRDRGGSRYDRDRDRDRDRDSRRDRYSDDYRRRDDDNDRRYR
ncbi:MAG: tetratricopeptide repeat protein, partial [Bacteroidota bacterium]